MYTSSQVQGKANFRGKERCFAVDERVHAPRTPEHTEADTTPTKQRNLPATGLTQTTHVPVHKSDP